MGKKILITGINGYFASTLLPYLDTDLEIEEIIGVDLTPWKGGYPKVRFHKADIRDESLAPLFKNVDAVFHLAFVESEMRDKDKIDDININGSKNVFTACISHNVKKVIYASSLTVYGSFPDIPLGLSEEYPITRHPDSCYYSSKVEVENFVTEFFKNHPDITLTVLRSGLLCGPNIRNMFSKLWSMKIISLPVGSNVYLQFIHEEDLGEALYLAYLKVLPGVYNVAADDALPAKWCFRQAGAVVIALPKFLQKLLADIGFKLKFFPAGSGWVCLSRHTVFTLTNKFKQASGWHPKYNSRETFESYMKSRVRDAKDNLVQSVLSWVFASGARIRPTMSVLHLFKLGRIKAFRNIQPWMNPKKNSMTYLPISYKPQKTTRKISIDEKAGEGASEILPQRIVHDFIEKAKYHVIMDRCGCRLAGECEHFTADIGCLFMGESALKLPHGVSHRVTKEQAHRHVERAIGVGLVPVVGKIRVDNFIFLTPDKNRLLSVCFCCHCCCMMGAFKHLTGEHLDQVMTPLEGVSVKVSEDCIGCGRCLETCIFEAIHIENGKALHSSMCRACGRCVTNCPQHAVEITIANPDTFAETVKQRIESYVRVV